MRSIPNFTVLTASDTVHTRWLLRCALEHPGPMYIRLSRDKLEDVYTEGESFQIGKGKIIRDGSDCTIVANGAMLAVAAEAAAELCKSGISARVVDMFCLKPFDRELLISCANETGIIVTAEEHSVIGGLGSAAAEVLSEERCDAAFSRIGVQDEFTQSGDYGQLLQSYGLAAERIVKEVKRHCHDRAEKLYQKEAE